MRRQRVVVGTRAAVELGQRLGFGRRWYVAPEQTARVLPERRRPRIKPAGTWSAELPADAFNRALQQGDLAGHVGGDALHLCLVGFRLDLDHALAIGFHDRVERVPHLVGEAGNGGFGAAIGHGCGPLVARVGAASPPARSPRPIRLSRHIFHPVTIAPEAPSCPIATPTACSPGACRSCAGATSKICWRRSPAPPPRCGLLGRLVDRAEEAGAIGDARRLMTEAVIARGAP
jgi:hypothetical protein